MLGPINLIESNMENGKIRGVVSNLDVYILPSLICCVSLPSLVSVPLTVASFGAVDLSITLPSPSFEKTPSRVPRSLAKVIHLNIGDP